MIELMAKAKASWDNLIQKTSDDSKLEFLNFQLKFFTFLANMGIKRVHFSSESILL